MTIRQAYDLYQQLVDQARAPFLTPPRFLRAYVAERLAWLKDKGQEPETEYVTNAIDPFRRQAIRTAGLDTGILLSSLSGNFFMIRSVTADFEAKGLYNRPCDPVQDIQKGVALTNAVNKPGDWFPKHKKERGRIQVYSQTIPSRVVVDYLVQPDAPTLTQTAASDLLEGDLYVREILERLAGRQDLSTENYNRSQLTTGQQTNRETNK